MAPPSSTGTLSKAKTALFFLSLAMAMLLLLRTVYACAKNSSTVYLSIAANIIILFLVFHYRRNPDQIPHPPLFSFPSLSLQPRYRPFKENNADLPEPVVSLPPVVPQHVETETVYDRRNTDGAVWERGESSERISTEYREQEIYNLVDDRAEAEDEQGSGMDETWNSIVARGKAKPVRLFTSNQKERNTKPEMKKPMAGKRREKKKVTEHTGYDHSNERREQGSRKNGATGISSEELSHLSERFISKHYNTLRMERQESHQRRLMKRLNRFTDYRNAVPAS